MAALENRVGTPMSMTSVCDRAAALWLADLNSETSDLLGENKELEKLVEEARKLCERADEIRSRPSSACQRAVDELQADHDKIRRRAEMSRPTSAASSRRSFTRPTSAGGFWKKPTSRPVSAKSRAKGYATPKAAPSPSSKVVREFIVELDRTGGQDNLGMKIRCDTFLEVTKVKDEGLVAAWNARRSDTAIRKGDRIVEVNGERGSAQSLLQEVTREAPLRIVIQRAEVETLRLDAASPTSAAPTSSPTSPMA
mmetsp:Transcript_65300/g.199829  ORF Transcript_65300/g.199829 Transcript_65300/m.199829 type:complete len:254 (-) Transcript_65300:105-866(-)